MGLPWTPNLHDVELWLNGTYRGVYQLGEGIEVDADRVDIDTSDDPSLGGYLLEADSWDDDKPSFKTNHGLQVFLNEPEIDDPEAASTYAAGVGTWVQEFEDALYSGHFDDPETGYRHYVDVPSFVNWYLVNELTKNVDSGFNNSCWMYRDVDGLLTMGPVWDFDVSAGNRQPPELRSPTGWFLRHPSAWSQFKGPEGHWLVRMFEDPWFVAQVQARWQEVRLSLLTLPAYAEAQATDIAGAARRNFAPVEEGGAGMPIGPTFIDNDGVFQASWAESEQYVATWMAERIAWMDEQYAGSGHSVSDEYATTPRRSRATTSRAVLRSGVSPAASATCPARSSSCFIQRTKSPAARSVAPSTESRSSPSAQRYAAQAKPRSGSRRKSSRCSLSSASSSAQSRTISAIDSLTSPPGIRGERASSGRRASKTRTDSAAAELGRRQVVPEAVPQRLGGEQVDVGVDPHQVPAALGDVVAVEVLQRGQHLADPVELPGHGVRALLDATAQRLRVAVELEPPLAPAGVVLAVRALVAGVRLQLRPEPVDLVVGGGPRRAGRALVAVPGGRRRGQVVRPGPQRGREVAAHLRVAAVEVPRHLQPGQRGDRLREVDHRQPSGLPLRGHDVRARLLAREPGVDDHREPRELAGGHLDHVAGLEPGQRRQRLLPPVGPARPGGLLLQVGDPAAERGVLHEVAEVAGRGLAVALERVLALAQLPGQPDHGLVGLELRERLLQQLAGRSSRPNWCTRLTAMLYDGRNDDRSG